MKKYTIAEIETNENLFVHCSLKEEWEKLKKACKNGQSTLNYYGNDFYNFCSGHFKPRNERTKIEFNQVMFEEEFVLPEKWCIRLVSKEINDAVNSINLWELEKLIWEDKKIIHHIL